MQSMQKEIKRREKKMLEFLKSLLVGMSVVVMLAGCSTSVGPQEIPRCSDNILTLIDRPDDGCINESTHEDLSDLCRILEDE